MRDRRDVWLATGLALISLAGFLVLRPQPAPVDRSAPGTLPAVAATTTADADPLLEPVPESVSRVLAGSGNAEVVDPDQVAALPESVVRVLVDRRAVLTLPEDAP